MITTMTPALSTRSVSSIILKDPKDFKDFKDLKDLKDLRELITPNSHDQAYSNVQAPGQ